MALDMDRLPNLLEDDSFYSVLCMRIAEHLESVGCKDGDTDRAYYLPPPAYAFFCCVNIDHGVGPGWKIKTH